MLWQVWYRASARPFDGVPAYLAAQDDELNWRRSKIDKLTDNVAYYKRHYFGG